MCIRDRVGPARAEALPGGRAARVDVGGSPGPGGAAHGRGPVSYTHLRAHETVLDLVCRLLLENKKEPTHQQSHYRQRPIKSIHLLE